MKLGALVIAIVVGLVGLVADAREARAQRTCPYSVSPSGPTLDVPTHPDYVTAIDVWGPLATGQSSLDPKDYEVKPLNDRSIAIRPRSAKAGPGNIVLPTKAGVSVALSVRVVADRAEVCLAVPIELITEEEAFRRRVDEEVRKRTSALEAEVATMRAEMADRVRAQFDDELATRAVQRRELARTRYVDRNDSELIVRVGEILYLGDGALVAFEVQNRRKSAVAIASVALMGDGGDQAAAVALAGGPGGGALGRVASNSVGRGVAVVRSVARLRGKSLSLVVRPAAGQGDPVNVGGVVLK